MAQRDLRQVQKLAQSVQKAEAELREGIRIARESGETLEDIGRAAGLTRQRIHQIVGKRLP